MSYLTQASLFVNRIIVVLEYKANEREKIVIFGVVFKILIQCAVHLQLQCQPLVNQHSDLQRIPGSAVCSGEISINSSLECSRSALPRPTIA